jgi:hypothetical protein
VSILSMAAALHIFDADIANTGSIVVVVVFIGLLQFVLGPLLQWIATRFGVLGIIIMSLISGPLIVYLALSLAPGITPEESIDALYIGWTYALGLTLAQWMVVSQSNDILLAEIIRKSRKPAKSVSTKPGYLFIQLDGVSWPILDLQLKAGNLPNISKLIDDEGYVFRPWTTQLPSTTPVSQAGILLGSHKNIPAFRWYEKDSAKLFVANQPSDAVLIEERLSNGDGLLVDGGVSIGNLFSGDAATNIMVMSKLGGDRSAIKNMSDYMDYFTAPVGFMRAIMLSFGEMAKELFQAR